MREREREEMAYSGGGMLDREDEEGDYDEDKMMTPLAMEQQPHVRIKARIRELRMFQAAALVLFIAAIVFLVLFVQQTGSPSVKKEEEDDVVQTMYATCVLLGGGGVRGVVTMWQAKRNEDITLEVTVSGLEPGEHGFHIHELYVFLSLTHTHTYALNMVMRERERGSIVLVASQ